MIKKIETGSLKPVELDALYAEGFRFYCDGDYKLTGFQDPCGYPCFTNNIYVFTNRADANAFAEKQIYPINPSVHALVHEIPAHTETLEERRNKEAEKKAKAKAERERKEAEKAKKANMTVEEYRAEKKRLATIKRKEKAITDLKNRIEADKRRLERMKVELAELLK